MHSGGPVSSERVIRRITSCYWTLTRRDGTLLEAEAGTHVRCQPIWSRYHEEITACGGARRDQCWPVGFVTVCRLRPGQPDADTGVGVSARPLSTKRRDEHASAIWPDQP